MRAFRVNGTKVKPGIGPVGPIPGALYLGIRLDGEPRDWLFIHPNDFVTDVEGCIDRVAINDSHTPDVFLVPERSQYDDRAFVIVDNRWIHIVHPGVDVLAKDGRRNLHWDGELLTVRMF